MIGYILTTEQHEQIQGQFYAPYEFFSCVQDINNVWFLFLSEEDKAKVLDTEWNWILSLTEAEYTPPQSSILPE